MCPKQTGRMVFGCNNLVRNWTGLSSRRVCCRDDEVILEQRKNRILPVSLWVTASDTARWSVHAPLIRSGFGSNPKYRQRGAVPHTPFKSSDCNASLLRKQALVRQRTYLKMRCVLGQSLYAEPTLGRRQAVRHSTLTAAFAGSSPATPATEENGKEECDETDL